MQKKYYRHENIENPQDIFPPNEGNNIEEEFDTDLLDVHCPNCGIGWLENFAPEFCPRCGTKVTDTPGEGFSWNIEVAEKLGFPWAVFNCPNCDLVIPKKYRHKMKFCFRCYTPFTQANTKSPSIKSLIGKIIAKL